MYAASQIAFCIHGTEPGQTSIRTAVQSVFIVESMKERWDPELDFALLQLADDLGLQLGHFGLLSLEFKDIQAMEISAFTNDAERRLARVETIDYNDHFLSILDTACLEDDGIGRALVTYSEKFGYCVVGLIVGTKTGLYLNNAKIDAIVSWQKGQRVADVQLYQPLFDKVQEIKVQLLSKLQKGIIYITRLNRSQIAISTIDKQVILYDTALGKVLQTFSHEFLSRTLVAHENLLAYTNEKQVVLVDWVQQKVLQLITCP